MCDLDGEEELLGVLQLEEAMAAVAVRSASRICCIRTAHVKLDNVCTCQTRQRLTHVKLDNVIHVKQYQTTIEYST